MVIDTLIAQPSTCNEKRNQQRIIGAKRTTKPPRVQCRSSHVHESAMTSSRTTIRIYIRQHRKTQIYNRNARWNRCGGSESRNKGCNLQFEIQ